jgi:hypothetical protein
MVSWSSIERNSFGGRTQLEVHLSLCCLRYCSIQVLMLSSLYAILANDDGLDDDCSVVQHLQHYTAFANPT